MKVILRVISPNVKRSYLYHGITEAIGDELKFYIAESLRVIANSFESKEFFINDNIMKSIFSGTGIKSDDGVKLISSGGKI